MKRLLAPAVITAAALAAGGLALAAHGSGDDASGPASAVVDSTSAAASTATPSATVNLVKIDELGTVLTDADGRVLYAADEEQADPSVICTDACQEFWAPLEAGTDAPTGAPGVTGLDVADRPDGTSQVTFEGRRLYTFTLDEPGQASGEGFSDTFGGQRFTWHAVVVDGTNTAARRPTPPTPPRLAPATSTTTPHPEQPNRPPAATPTTAAGVAALACRPQPSPS